MIRTEVTRKYLFACLLLQACWLRSPVVAQVPGELTGHQRIIEAKPSIAAQTKGGSVQILETLRAETFLTDSGIQIRMSRKNGTEIDLQHCRGIATLRIAGMAKSYRFDLLPSDGSSLAASTSLAYRPGKQIELEVTLVSLPAELASGGKLRFRDVITIPHSLEQRTASAVALQGLCPVSGQQLGSMGSPIPVSIGNQTVYVCCSGCVPTVRENPARYLAGKPPIRIVDATAADDERIHQQQTCPVMDEKLGSMGPPIKVMVGQKPIFLCCKGCIKKLKSEPLKYLTLVYGSTLSKPNGAHSRNENPIASQRPKSPMNGEEVRPGVYKVTAEDQPFIQAQQRCPVMDEPLDAMGGPYKVEASGRTVYICCPGCAKRIASEPAKYLAILADQGVTAPTIR